MNETIAVVSGGMDSATLLYWLLDQGREVKALSVNYGQRHVKELPFAVVLCAGVKVEQRIVDLTSLKDLLSGSALMSDDVEVPEGPYTDENMKATVVPNRNALILNVAIAWAISLKFDQVAYAAHAGDHTVYPDCRPEFIRKIDELAGLADWHRVSVVAPFVNMKKAEIVKLGVTLKVPFGNTWSCYNGRERQCGRCATCSERKEAFELAGVPDPTKYEEG